MNSKTALQLFDVLGEINDDYIVKAINTKPVNKADRKRYLRYFFPGVSAACICLVAVCTAIIIGINNNAINPAGSSDTSSDISYTAYSDECYDTVIYNDTVYKRINYISPDDEMRRGYIGTAEVTDADGNTENHYVFSLKGIRPYIAIAVRMDYNTYCRYVTNSTVNETLLSLICTSDLDFPYSVNYFASSFSDHSEQRFTSDSVGLMNQILWLTFYWRPSYSSKADWEYLSESTDNYISVDLSCIPLGIENAKINIKANGTVTVVCNGTELTTEIRLHKSEMTRLLELLDNDRIDCNEYIYNDTDSKEASLSE